MGMRKPTLPFSSQRPIYYRCWWRLCKVYPRKPSNTFTIFISNFDITDPPREEEMVQQLTPAEIMNTIASLAVATNNIQQSLSTFLERSTTSRSGNDKSLIQKPWPYTGKSSPDVCHFIVAFTLYAQDMGTKLNEHVTVGTELWWKLNDQK